MMEAVAARRGDGRASTFSGQAVEPHDPRRRRLPDPLQGLLRGQRRSTLRDLKPPLGSGPYKVGRVVPGQTIEYERVAGLLGQGPARSTAASTISTGSASSSTATARRPSKPSRRATSITAQEFTSRIWATDYNFPAIAEGKVVKREFPDEKRPSMQAVAVNQRRERFRDRARPAGDRHCASTSNGRSGTCSTTPTSARSPVSRSRTSRRRACPRRRNWRCSSRLRDKLPPEAFGEAVTQAVIDGSGRDRKLLAQASKLLAEAGWTRPAPSSSTTGARG